MFIIFIEKYHQECKSELKKPFTIHSTLLKDELPPRTLLKLEITKVMERNVSQKTDHYYCILFTKFFIQAVEKQSVSSKVEEIMTNLTTTRMTPYIEKSSSEQSKRIT